MIVRSAARRLADAQGATFVLRDGPDCFYADEDAISPGTVDEGPTGAAPARTS